MALARAKLADPQYVPAAAGSLYANPSSSKTLVVGLTLFNGNTTVETVKVYVVPDSAAALGTADASNQVLELEIEAKDTVFAAFPFGVMLVDENDSVQAATNTASKVVALVHGDKIT